MYTYTIKDCNVKVADIQMDLCNAGAYVLVPNVAATEKLDEMIKSMEKLHKCTASVDDVKEEKSSTSESSTSSKSSDSSSSSSSRRKSKKQKSKKKKSKKSKHDDKRKRKEAKKLEEAKAEKRKANELEKKVKEQGKIAQKALGPKIKKAEKLAGEIQSAMAQPHFSAIVPDHYQKKCDETLATLRSHINLWMNVVTMGLEVPEVRQGVAATNDGDNTLQIVKMILQKR